MRYLKKLTENEFSEWKSSNDYITPNVVLIKGGGNIVYNKRIVGVGDVVYYNDGSLIIVPINERNNAFGTPIGIITIPYNFLPDKQARMIALKSNLYEPIVYNDERKIFKNVPITKNIDTNAENVGEYGFLSSDMYSDIKSVVNNDYGYYGNVTLLVPTPYLPDTTLNPEFNKPLEGGNILSDINGKFNTVTDLSAHSVNGISGISWYVPAAGEMAIAIANLAKINDSLRIMGGTTYSPFNICLTSTVIVDGGNASGTFPSRNASIYLTDGFIGYNQVYADQIGLYVDILFGIL